MDQIKVLSRTQRIIVDQATNTVRVVEAGPVGPAGYPGAPGEPGPPGQSSGEEVADLVEAHVASETPHPAYDDIPDLTILFENGLY